MNPTAHVLAAVQADVVACGTCNRLVEWRERVARERRAGFRDEEYWGKAVPAFGDPDAEIVILGLAPAAHGANRTGRMFTGDRSGEWLFRAMHRAGLANQPDSTDRNDGLKLHNAWVTAAVRCAPPGNQPLPAERDACASYLVRELDALAARCRVVVCLGGFGFDAAVRHYRLKPKPRFGHLAEHTVPGGGPVLLCSFHPSQLNTFTGRLTEAMLDAVFERAVQLAE
jgi:uracil-DNA glycosylase family 4